MDKKEYIAVLAKDDKTGQIRFLSPGEINEINNWYRLNQKKENTRNRKID
jgi:hypothetical protein